jgi:uncharacterized membrane protein
MKILIYYITTLTSLAILDWLWLGVITKNFYKDHLGGLFRADFLWPAIILFYLLYAAAIVYFAILPAQGIWTKALLAGILLGFTAYMTYDLVNFATLKDWPLTVVLADIAWGCFITGVAATIGTLIGKIS